MAFMLKLCGSARRSSMRFLPWLKLLILHRFSHLLGSSADCGALALAAVVIGFLSPGTLQAEIIPAARRMNWVSGAVGVPGGIPNRTVLFCNVRQSIPGTNIVAKGDGIQDDSPAIQAALKLCPPNQVVFLPAGTYRCAQCLAISRSGVTLRGEGMGKTTLVEATTNNCSGFITMGIYRENPAADRTIYSGFKKGSSNIVVSSAAGLNTDTTMLKIWETNSPTVRHVSSTINLIRHMAKVVKIQGTNITFWPPLVYDFVNKPTYKYHDLNLIQFSGIEDLSIDVEKPSNGFSIYFQQTFGCWLKRVETHKASNSHVFSIYSACNEIRGCFIHDAFSFGANAGVGIELYTHNTGFLIEDNIISDAFPSIMLSGSASGCVVSYNFSHNPQSGSTIIGSDLNCNHGPHNVMNLFEGNVGTTLQSDGYFGSASETTVFRNWLTGTHPTLTLNRKSVDICRWSRNFNVVGNVLGVPAWPGGYQTYTNNFTYRFPTIYRLGYPNMGNNSYTGTNPPSASIDALDLNVEKTLLRHGNYDYATKKVNWDPTITDHTIPASLFYTATPSWWPSGLAWPPIGPDRTPMTGLIPAQIRFGNAPEMEAPQNLRQASP